MSLFLKQVVFELCLDSHVLRGDRACGRRVDKAGSASPRFKVFRENVHCTVCVKTKKQDGFLNKATTRRGFIFSKPASVRWEGGGNLPPPLFIFHSFKTCAPGATPVARSRAEDSHGVSDRQEPCPRGGCSSAGARHTEAQPGLAEQNYLSCI